VYDTVFAVIIMILYMKTFYLLACLAICVLSSDFEPVSNSCAWRNYRYCPIDTSGSDPICDYTIPMEITPGVFGLKICVSETPKLIGDKFDVGLALFGTILTVDVIPDQLG